MNNKYEVSLQVKMIRQVIIFLIISVIILVVSRLSLGPLHPLALTAAVSAILTLLIVYLSIGILISASTCAWLVTIILWLGLSIAGYGAGGLNAPVIIAFCIIPLASALLINHRAAIIMGLLTELTIIIYFILESKGSSLPIPLDNQQMHTMRGLWIFFVIVMATVFSWYYSHKNKILTKSLQDLANTDFLTKLANRRLLDELVTRELFRTHRHKHWLSVLMIDIDHFKNFNDAEGHLKGDECLSLIANKIKTFCQRATDVAGRYGGEEFMLILPDTDPEAAKTLAENLRQAVEEIEIQFTKSKQKKLTITIGCASTRGTEFSNSKELVDFVDGLLYQGKTSGRNQVVTATKIQD